jgi:hypothetical protein
MIAMVHVFANTASKKYFAPIVMVHLFANTESKSVDASNAEARRFANIVVEGKIA